MDVELQDAPLCCQKALEQIRDKYEAVACLEEFLAVAPTLTKPMLRVSFLGVLWRIAKGTLDWRKYRKATSATVAPILANRVRHIIDSELLRHNNDAKLSMMWTRLRHQLAG